MPKSRLKKMIEKFMGSHRGNRDLRSIIASISKAYGGVKGRENLFNFPSYSIVRLRILPMLSWKTRSAFPSILVLPLLIMIRCLP